MRSDRFTSLAAVIALVATVQVANAASDADLLTVTLTRTVYNKPMETNAPMSSIQKSRGYEQHTIVNEPETITRYITEYYRATRVSNSAVPTSKPMSISSANPVVIVSASPTIVNSVMPSLAPSEEEVIIKTKTKKNKTKLKTKTKNKNSTAMESVTQSVPMTANPVQTAPASVVVPISHQPSSVASPSLVSKSGLSSFASASSSLVMMPSESESAALPLGTSSVLSGSIPPAAAPSVSAVPNMVSTVPVSQQPASALPTMVVVAVPSQTKQSPSIDSVNNKKINPPAASARPANGSPSDRSVAPALFLAWLMAAVAAF